MILITGATGNVGLPLLKALADRDDVRALVPNEEEAAKAAANGATPAIADLADPTTLAPAFDGVDRLFLLSPFIENQAELEHAALDAAEKAGVKRVVKLAYAGVEWPIALTEAHREIEARLAGSTFDVTLLHSDVFASNLLTQAEYLRGGQLVLPGPAAKIAYVDPADVAAVAAALLTREDTSTTPDVVTVTGPEQVTNADVAAIAGRVLGRDVQAVDVPAGPWAAALVDAGVPAFIAEAVGEMHETIESHGPIAVSPATLEFAGRPPRSLEEFLAEHLAPVPAV